MRRLSLLLVLVVAGVAGQQAPAVRLAGRAGKPELGWLEVWGRDGWAALCDAGLAGWTRDAADLACRELGYTGATEHTYGSNVEVAVPATLPTATTGLDCRNAASWAECKLAWGTGCPVRAVPTVACRAESRSACPPGAAPALGSCYTIHSLPATFPQAQV